MQEIGIIYLSSQGLSIEDPAVFVSLRRTYNFSCSLIISNQNPLKFMHEKVALLVAIYYPHLLQ